PLRAPRELPEKPRLQPVARRPIRAERTRQLNDRWPGQWRGQSQAILCRLDLSGELGQLIKCFLARPRITADHQHDAATIRRELTKHSGRLYSRVSTC